MSGLSAQAREVRAKRIGASEAAAVLCLSPYAGPFDAWARIVHGIEREAAPELVAGSYLERAVLDWYSDTRKATLTRQPPAQVHPDHDWLSATPDAIAVLGTGGFTDVVGVEAKTARFRDDWGSPGTAEVPLAYAAQAQIQMAVFGFGEVEMPVLFTQSSEFACYTVPRDQPVIDVLLRDLGAWFERHVVGGVMPDLDGGSAAADFLRKRYPGGAPLVTATPEQAAIVAEYAADKATEKALKKTLAVKRQRVLLALGDALGFEDLCSYKPDKNGKRTLLLQGEKE